MMIPPPSRCLDDFGHSCTCCVLEGKIKILQTSMCNWREANGRPLTVKERISDFPVTGEAKAVAISKQELKSKLEESTWWVLLKLLDFFIFSML